MANVLMQEPAILDGNAMLGDDFAFYFEIPWDMTGWYAQIDIRKTPDSLSDPIQSLRSVDGGGLVVVPGITKSIVSGYATGSVMAAAKQQKVYYGMAFRDTDGKVRTWVTGSIVFKPQLVELPAL